jgi:hypothetical protein
MKEYRSHPVADLFPMLEPGSRQYNDLQESMLTVGLLEPIMVDGDIILDGRNRLAICIANRIAPKFIEWSTQGIELDQPDWIFERNVNRRHLTDEQRAALYVSYNAWIRDEARRENAQFKEGNLESRKGGLAKAGKLPMNPKSDSSAAKPKRDIAAMNANSTAGKVAAATGVSRYKAQQILTLNKQAKAGDASAGKAMEEIKTGRKSLKEAKQLNEAKLGKTEPIIDGPKPLQQRLRRAWARFWKNFEPEERPAVIKWINENL